jgi:hypothetical protein
VAALHALSATQATIVGGPDVVSDGVANQLVALGITVTRSAGPDRYATSAAIGAAEVSAGMSAAKPWLVVGNNWPDALSAGPAAAHDGGALILVDGTNLANSAATQAWLAGVAPGATQIRLIGGPDVLSPADQVECINLASA